MSDAAQKRIKKQGRGRPPLSGNVTIEVFRSEQLDITKLAQAMEQYMRYMAEPGDSTKPTRVSTEAASIPPVLGSTETNTQKSIKTTGHSIERKH